MGSQAYNQKSNKSNLLKKMSNQLRKKQGVVVVKREELMRALRVKKSGEEAATISATIEEGKKMVKVEDLNGLQKLSQARTKKKSLLMLRRRRNRKRKSNSNLKSKKRLNQRNRMSRKRSKKLPILKAQRKKRSLKKRKKRRSRLLNQRRMLNQILHNLKCQTWLK